MNRLRLLVAAAAAASCLLGCAGVGPRAVRAERFHYNEALAETIDEQLLLNLVRLRYRDTPFFLEVSNVTTQYEFAGSASVSGLVASDDEVGAGTGIAYAERPTVIYTPLAGGDFARRLLTPLSPESLMLLTGAGWRTERVLRCGVVRLNDLWNAPRASGPTPNVAPEYEAFHEMTDLLAALSARRATRLGYERIDGLPRLVLRIDASEAGSPERRRLNELLGLDPARHAFPLTTETSAAPGRELQVVTRSLIGVMYYLSQGVDVPEADRDRGLVTVTRHPDGREFDWSEVLGGLMHIRSSDDRPRDAAVQVRYRGTWFYIDDADLESKSTFHLLGQLFNLQAGEVRGEAPLLTLPVGN